MKRLFTVGKYYSSSGLFTSLWTVLRLIVLPIKQIDNLVVARGKIVDIGCGNGGLTNYLSTKSKRRQLIGIDLDRKRITTAFKTKGKRQNIEFIFGDVTKYPIGFADNYLIADVLHHIPFPKQIKLLGYLAKKMKKDSELIVKEVNNSDHRGFVFGQFFEKLLYPQERIYARSTVEWGKIFTKLGFSYATKSGNWYFPDSTTIFICRLRL